MPPFLLPLLFTVGSVAANTIAAGQQARAAQAANDAERVRQQAFNEQSMALNEQSRSRYETAADDTRETGSRLAGLYETALTSAPSRPIAEAPPSDSNLVVSRDATAQGGAMADTADEARRFGQFRGFGDFMTNAGMGLARDASEMGVINSMRRGSQSVLPMELDAASKKGAGMRTLADALQLGSVVTSGGGSLAGMFGGAPAAAGGTLASGPALFGSQWTGAY